MNGKRYDVAIIGGGHNGLTCAAYLARAGLDVIVLEKNEQARDGYREQSDSDEVQAARWIVMMSSSICRQPR